MKPVLTKIPKLPEKVSSKMCFENNNNKTGILFKVVAGKALETGRIRVRNDVMYSICPRKLEIQFGGTITYMGTTKTEETRKGSFH